MDMSFTEGPTNVSVRSSITGYEVHISIVSRRLWRLIMIKSKAGKWNRQAHFIMPPVDTWHFMLRAFQPSTGRVLATKE